VHRICCWQFEYHLRHWQTAAGVVATQNYVVTKEKEMANYYLM
jgi:hypothetical protein